jgi:hypothetical protein
VERRLHSLAEKIEILTQMDFAPNMAVGPRAVDD